ncbi:MAG: urease accessory UreF family protein [Gammaproteobacteria bacterium]|nr:urease accessory UreF family protein [Gammaproteobacteria bacterium]
MADIITQPTPLSINTHMPMTEADAACSPLLRLLQLVSPALPVGAYAYSQGMEYAVHAGWIHDEDTARDWIGELLAHSVSSLDAPVLIRLYDAWERDHRVELHYWSRLLYASRESAELQAEDRALASAMMRLLADLGIPEAKTSIEYAAVTYAALFALAARRWQVPVGEAVQGYLWAWAENQVAVALKLVPLGQTAGQRILLQIGCQIPALAQQAMMITDEEIGQLSHGLAMASAWHETQYTRLFRS